MFPIPLILPLCWGSSTSYQVLGSVSLSGFWGSLVKGDAAIRGADSELTVDSECLVALGKGEGRLTTKNKDPRSGFRRVNNMSDVPGRAQVYLGGGTPGKEDLYSSSLTFWPPSGMFCGQC